jgi:hypothetical protein
MKKHKWLSSTPRYNKSNLYAFNWCNEAEPKSNDDSGVVLKKNLMTTQESGDDDSGVVGGRLRSRKVDDSSGGLNRPGFVGGHLV